MSLKKLVAGNWKMHGVSADLDQVRAIASAAQGFEDVDVALCVPAILIDRAARAVPGFSIGGQDVHHADKGAHTGCTSALMLLDAGASLTIVGHSERREYFNESNQVLAEKINRCLEHSITPIFCCGEPLSIREAGTQNEYVAKQLKESLYHLSADQLKSIVIAYEPIWAIGTGKTATTEQAQEMHAYLRSVLAKQYSSAIASEISILYGGSVKANNAKELFGCPDVDGGLVGGASIIAADFITIIRSLK